MNKQKTISIKTILMLVVILLGAIPLALMETIVSTTVRENTLKNTTVLTRGILEQSQKHLNSILDNTDTFTKDLSKSKHLSTLLEQNHITDETIQLLSLIKKEFNIISDLVIIDTDKNYQSLLFNNTHPNGKILEKDPTEMFLKSQQAILLKENHTRNLWLGTSPKGIKGLSHSIWNYKMMKTETANFIIAVSININLLKVTLFSVEEATTSEVRLITSDNAIYPSDDKFFNYNFAAKTLSRSEKGRFISFSDNRQKNGESEELLIQLYSDPLYFYNLIILTPEKELLKGFKTITKTTSTALIFLTIFSISFGLISITFFQKRIKELMIGLKHASTGTDSMSIPDKKLAIKENIQITKAIIEVAEEVAQNKEKLKQINEKLEKRVMERTDELKTTRESLFNSEKMAVLGNNAAKISHEINNPLGISITAASHISSIIKELKTKFENNTLSKTYLTEFTSTALEVTNMIENNLMRASELSASFKNLASDQSSDEIRSINVGNYINQIIKSYSYKLKNDSYKINLICNEQLKIETYPAIIYQTITNLINNCILHGFENRKEGTIDVIVAEEKNTIQITVKDDGSGISKENLDQLYKPFFTTKYGKGGTGLGLNIIKDLIENKLRGSIKCTSTLGEGTNFTIQIPKGES